MSFTQNFGSKGNLWFSYGILHGDNNFSVSVFSSILVRKTSAFVPGCIIYTWT